MKKVISGIIVLVGTLIALSFAQAGEYGVGGGHMDGHSWSGMYSVDQGYVGYINAEADRHKGFTFGGQYMFREYNSTINGDGGEKIKENTIHAHTFTTMVRYYPVDVEGRSSWRVLQPFVGVHAGYEFATDADAFITAVQAGLSVGITDNLTVEAAYTYWVRPADRNYKTTTLGFKFAF
jgi:opacity protein-like surface antigen